jgi:tyrosinase
LGGTGDKNTNECYLPNGEWVGKAVRKEYRMLNDEERRRFHDAMRAIKRNGELQKIAEIHKNYAVLGGAHVGPAFLPWHREFLRM